MTTKTFYYAAGGWGGGVEELRNSVLEELRERGWEGSPEVFDPDGQYLRTEVLEHDDGSCWLYLHRSSSSQESLLRALASRRDEPLTIFEVIIDEEAAKNGRDHGEALEGTSMRITPEGARREPSDLVDVGELVMQSGSDFHEKPHLAARSAVEEIAGPSGSAGTWRAEFYRDDEHSERLRDLISDMQRADEYSLDELHGQQMVRFELPDGTRRMSAVTDDELDVLSAEVGDPVE